MEHLTMSLGLKNLAPTQYTNYNFNSMIRFGGKVFASSDSGIFQLDSSDTDDGSEITAMLELVKTDFGSPNPKKVLKVMFGIEASGMMLATITSDDAVSNSGLMPATQINQEQHGDWSVMRSFGRYLSIRIQNVQGCDFSLDDIKVVLIISPFRRLKR